MQHFHSFCTLEPSNVLHGIKLCCKKTMTSFVHTSIPIYVLAFRFSSICRRIWHFHLQLSPNYKIIRCLFSKRYRSSVMRKESWWEVKSPTGISGPIQMFGVVQPTKKRKHLFTVMLIQITDKWGNFAAMNRSTALTSKIIMKN
jgi:hypothetical protein